MDSLLEIVVTGDTSIIGSPIPIALCSTYDVDLGFNRTDSEINSGPAMGEAWSSCMFGLDWIGLDYDDRSG
jgi:hypothetical protein